MTGRGNMNDIVGRSCIVVFLACVLTRNLPAQTQDGGPDTTRLPISEYASARSNYWIPALELPVFLASLNGAARVLYPNEMQDGKRVYSSTWETTRDHLKQQDWVNDSDPFNVNQF